MILHVDIMGNSGSYFNLIYFDSIAKKENGEKIEYKLYSREFGTTIFILENKKLEIKHKDYPIFGFDTNPGDKIFDIDIDAYKQFFHTLDELAEKEKNKKSKNCGYSDKINFELKKGNF